MTTVATMTGRLAMLCQINKQSCPFCIVVFKCSWSILEAIVEFCTGAWSKIFDVQVEPLWCFLMYRVYPLYFSYQEQKNHGIIWPFFISLMLNVFSIFEQNIHIHDIIKYQHILSSSWTLKINNNFITVLLKADIHTLRKVVAPAPAPAPAPALAYQGKCLPNLV